MRHLIIDDVTHKVYQENPSSHGYVELIVGLKGPESAHKVPAWWWHSSDASCCKTGGHRYGKR